MVAASSSSNRASSRGTAATSFTTHKQSSRQLLRCGPRGGRWQQQPPKRKELAPATEHVLRFGACARRLPCQLVASVPSSVVCRRYCCVVVVVCRCSFSSPHDRERNPAKASRKGVRASRQDNAVLVCLLQLLNDNGDADSDFPLLLTSPTSAGGEALFCFFRALR